jgi:hypothetical protein
MNEVEQERQDEIQEYTTSMEEKLEELQKPAQEDKRSITSIAMSAKTSVMDPVEYSQQLFIAKTLMDGKAIPQGFQSKEQVFMAILAGKEMDMGPIEAVNSLYFVNGKISLYGAGLVSRFRKFGWSIRFQDESSEECTAVVSKDGEEIQETFKFEDAEKSGYTKDYRGSLKFGWKEGMNRKLKLRYGVLNMIAKTYLPEVLGSVRGIVEIEEDFTPKGVDVENTIMPSPLDMQPKEKLELNKSVLKKIGGDK